VLLTNIIASWSKKMKSDYSHWTLIDNVYVTSKSSCSNIYKTDIRSTLQKMVMNPILTYFSRRHITVALQPCWASIMIHGLQEMIESWDLVNIRTLQHGEAPATHKRGSQQINFMFVLRSLVIHVEESGILPFNSMLSSEHRPIYVFFK
jgi:hypothetical protein